MKSTSLLSKVYIPAVDGRINIANSDTFISMEKIFKEKLDILSTPRVGSMAEIYPILEPITVSDLVLKYRDRQKFSQQQIAVVCKDYRDAIKQEGAATFFIFDDGVAKVNINFNGLGIEYLDAGCDSEISADLQPYVVLLP